MIKKDNGIKIFNKSIDKGDITWISLIPTKWCHYQRYNRKIKLNTESQIILIDLCRSKIYLKSSWFCEFPIFYYMDKEYLNISFSIVSILNDLKLKKKPINFDKTGFYESMIFDHPLRGRTLLKDIRQLIPGQTIVIDYNKMNSLGKNHFVLPFNSNYQSDMNKEKHIDMAVDILRNLLNNSLSELKGKLACPLSGGFDSRLLTCLLKEKSIDFDSFVVGPNESPDVKVAKKVANSLGLDLTHFELKNNYYKNYGNEVTFLTAGMSNNRHCHLYSYLRKKNIEYNDIFHGYLGDVYAGAHALTISKNISLSVEKSIHYFLKNNVFNRMTWHCIKEKYKTDILNDLKKIMEENCETNLPCHFSEYFFNVERQFSLISNVFCVLEYFGRLVRPFASKEYLLFFNSLPYEYRHNRFIFLEACKILFPKQFNIGNEVNQKTNNKFNQLSNVIFKRSYPAISIIFLILFKGNCVIKNPMQCERHNEVLLTVLKNELESAIIEMSDLMNTKFTRFRSITIKNRKENLGKFRLISTHYIIKNLLQ